MKVIAVLFALAGFAASTGGAWYLAQMGADEVEGQTSLALENALSAAAQDWAQVSVDGLRATISGTAPTEAARFRALDVAEAVIARAQINDTIILADAAVAPPEPLSFDILLASDLVTLLGSTPAILDAQLSDLTTAFDRRVVDLTRPVQTEPQADWQQTLTLLRGIAPQIATGRIMVTDGTLSVEAALPDAELRQKLLSEIAEIAPQGQDMALALSAPRMTLSPYPFDLSVHGGNFELSTCAATSESDTRQIVSLIAAATGLNTLDCSIALGAPDDNWPQTVQLAIELLADLPDADVSIRDRIMILSTTEEQINLRLEGTVQRIRDRLPEGYSLLVEELVPDVMANADPQQPAPPKGMTLTIAPGRLSAVGGVAGDAGVETLLSYARAAFPGRELSLDLIADIPGAAPPLADALALLDSLARLDRGTLRIDADAIHITGTGEGIGLSEQMHTTLGQRLSGDRDIILEIEEYAPAEIPEPVPARQPEVQKSPVECSAQIADVQQVDRIVFAPSSATLDITSARPLDAIARILATCPTAQVAVQAYTDSSGGAQMNQSISQDRADSVLDALLARGIFLDRMTATGYGEADPIADNATPEGREINRRVEFVLSATASAPDEANPEYAPAPQTSPTDEDDDQ